jgi:hypothetical protein
MGITTKAVLTEAYWSIGILEREYLVLYRAYKVISDELLTSEVKASAVTRLQIATKAVNNTTGPDRLILTLLVFGAYLQALETDLPALSVIQQAQAIKRAINKVTRIQAEMQVKRALNTYNSPDTAEIHSILLNSEVIV